jgi:hypothetical protein
MTKKIIVMLILVVSVTTLGFNQQRNPRYINRQNFIPFDINTPITIKGEIMKVDLLENAGRYGFGVHLSVNQEGKKYMVSVGPKFYLESQNWQLKKGDKVTIKAFKGIEENEGYFFASEVLRDGQKLILRDKYGFSMWRRSLQRGPGDYRAYWGRGYGGYGRGAYYRGGYRGFYGNRGYGRGAYYGSGYRGYYGNRGYGRGAYYDGGGYRGFYGNRGYGGNAYGNRGYGWYQGRRCQWVRGWKCWWYIPN